VAAVWEGSPAVALRRFEGREARRDLAGLCGVGNYLQMSVAVAPGNSADTVMGAEAAALQEAMPVVVMVAAVVLETDHTGAWTGT
jgi:hypothetical protein